MDTLDFYWQQQSSTYDLIYEMGFGAYVAKLPHLHFAFAAGHRIVRCMDERLGGGIRAAGSLLLLDEEAARAYVQAAQPVGLTSHAGCGAARLVFTRQHGEPSSNQVVEQFAQEQTASLAKKLGLTYLGHIAQSDMKGPSGQHIARCVYYVGTEWFNPNRVKELPPGFVVHRRYLGKAEALKETQLGLDIALGGHGFAARINQEAPFLLIAVGDSEQTNQLQEELKEIIRDNQRRVKVEGFSLGD